MQGITIIGPGRLGGALALALAHAGFRIDSLIYRSRKGVANLSSFISPRPKLISSSRLEPVESPIVLIAAQDDDLPRVIEMLRGKLAAGSAVFHTSGSLSSAILAPLR